MEFQQLFFDSTGELSLQGYFEWIYSLRAAGTPEISVRPCLSFVVETQKMFTHQNRVGSA